MDVAHTRPVLFGIAVSNKRIGVVYYNLLRQIAPENGIGNCGTNPEIIDAEAGVGRDRTVDEC